MLEGDLMSLNDMGWGVGRLSQEQPQDIILPAKLPTTIERWDQWEIRVPSALPGERVRARVHKNYDTYSEADLVQVIHPSPVRIEPKCSLAGKCAGCQFQHLSIEIQRDWKTDTVRKGLEKQAIMGYQELPMLKPTMGTNEIYGYRNKLTPHYDAPFRNKETGNFQMGSIGFQQICSRSIIDVEECPIATPAINAKMKETRVELHAKASQGLLNGQKKRKRHRRNKGDVGATLLFREADPDDNGNPVVVTESQEYMNTTVNGITFRYLAGNFFQNNNFVVPLMVDGVINAALEPTPAGEKLSYFIDCYCGSGLFALSAAAKFDVCVGIEVNSKAIEEATDNANRNKIKNCQFIAASAEAIFLTRYTISLEGCNDQVVQDFPREKTVVVLDPPRKGCSGNFLKQLYEYSPQRIVYMSCGPDTQARDAKGIVEVGGYDIVSIQPYDLFPQTKHIECLMVFEKRGPTQQLEL
jgi:23S rRNA (uracil1939-C5)-methyltransferase/tRNA (uracil-5-)-methyltransferase